MPPMSGYYVSPVPDSSRGRWLWLVRSEDRLRMTRAATRLVRWGRRLAVAGVLVMILDLLGTALDRFSLVFVWGPIVGLTLAVVLWKGVAWVRRGEFGGRSPRAD